jgi:hypothetical protein
MEDGLRKVAETTIFPWFIQAYGYPGALNLMTTHEIKHQRQPGI